MHNTHTKTQKNTHTIIILTVIQLCKHTHTHTNTHAHTKAQPHTQTRTYDRHTTRAANPERCDLLRRQKSSSFSIQAPSVVGGGDESRCISAGTRVTFSHGGCLEAQMCAGVISADSRGECGGKASLFMRLNESRCNFILWRRSPHVPPGRQRAHHV